MAWRLAWPSHCVSRMPARLAAAVVLGLLASCVTNESDAVTVNRRIWHVEFDVTLVGGPLAPRDERPSESLQPDCYPGCTCRFDLAEDVWDSSLHGSYASGGYHEVCRALNLDLRCTIRFMSNDETDGGCAFTTITQPGVLDFVAMHLRSR